MDNEQMRAAFSGSVIARAAKAIHDKGHEMGNFALTWDKLTPESHARYEQLAIACLSSLPTVSETEIKQIIREQLTEEWKDTTYARSWKQDILLEGCRAAKYVDPEEAADNFVEFIARAILQRFPHLKAGA